MHNQQNSTVRLWGILLLGLVILIAAFWQFGALRAQQLECAAGQKIDKTLPTGSRWELCWGESDAEGILLQQIYFTPPNGTRYQILKEAGLAQIYTHYDDGENVYHYLSAEGLGGDNQLVLTADDCPDGQLLQSGGKEILCQQIIPRGYLYRHFLKQRQGEALSLYSASDVGGPVYLVEWRFYDDGTIEPLVGDTGTLIHISNDATHGRPLSGALPDGGSRFGVGYINNVYWRLDFDIGASATDSIVEEMELLPAGNNAQRVLNIVPIDTESARSTFLEQKRSWRVRSTTITNSDGHPISYQVEPRNLGHQYVGGTGEPWTQHQLYVTVNKPCERLATQNPQASPCGSDVSQFVNGESLTSADLVLWYGASSHRLITDEDEPVKPTQWLSFQIIPRDWTAENALVE